VQHGTSTGNLRFASELKPGLGAELVIIAVGTHDGDGGWQTRTIESCLAGVVPLLDDDAAIVIRSTLPPAFLPALRTIVAGQRAATGRGPLPLLVNPEFTKEGTAVGDFLAPDRIVIGQIDDPTGAGVARVR